MKLSEIHMRDPFILVDNGKYYLYGSRGYECAWKCTGLDVYVSSDLKNWTDAHEVFTPPEDFWSCLDGTLYVENGVPYMIFCHEWTQVGDGEMCVMELTKDLKKAASEPKVLFRASEPSWSDGYKPGKYVTDGPFIYRTKEGRLIMIWSSFSKHQYCEAISYSDSGSIFGNWIHDDRLLFETDGGHGMIFEDKNGELLFVQHMPNIQPDERPHLYKIIEKDNTIFVE